MDLGLFLLLILGIALGGGIIFLILRPQLKATIKINEDTIKQNKDIEIKNKQLLEQKKNLLLENNVLKNQISKTQLEYNSYSAKRDEIKNNLEILEQQSNDAVKKIYDSATQVAQISFDKEIETMSNDLNEKAKNLRQNYLNIAKDCVENFQQQINAKQKELEQVSFLIKTQEENYSAMVASAKRRQKMENEKDFFRIVLSPADIDEIKRLREVLPFLRDKTPLNKVIYKVYYEKPLTDMIGRVVGKGIHTGIYKITNTKNEKCYIGQSASIADRWRQHVKRGVGAEDWTRNKLYPAMYSIGVENFTFEIVEECDRSQLNDREKYWQEFFHAKDFGYSIK